MSVPVGVKASMAGMDTTVGVMVFWGWMLVKVGVIASREVMKVGSSGEPNTMNNKTAPIPANAMKSLAACRFIRLSFQRDWMAWLEVDAGRIAPQRACMARTSTG
jgi:hypothetical protein